MTNIDLILTSRFYTGMVRGNDGTGIKSNSHEALVSAALFGRVQAKLGRRRTSIHFDKKLNHRFRGFVRCECGRVYTPYEQKGITNYGARCDGSCPNKRKSGNRTFVCGAAGSCISTLAFTADELARIEAATQTEVARLEEKQVGEPEDKARRHKTLREDLADLSENRLTLLRSGAYKPEVLAAEEARPTHALERIEEVPATGRELRGTISELLKLSELLKMATHTTIWRNRWRRSGSPDWSFPNCRCPKIPCNSAVRTGSERWNPEFF